MAYQASQAPTSFSVNQASRLVCRLPPGDSERLRTFALCVARRQRCIEQRREGCWPHYLPPAVVEHPFVL